MKDDYDFANMRARPNPYPRLWQVWIEGEFAGGFPGRDAALAEAAVCARKRNAEAIVVNDLTGTEFRVAADGTRTQDEPSR